MRLLKRRLAKLEGQINAETRAQGESRASAIISEALTKLSDDELKELGRYLERIRPGSGANCAPADMCWWDSVTGVDDLVAAIRAAIRGENEG